MKSFGIAAAAAALFGTLVAGAHHEHNAAHNALHQLKNRQAATTCGCTTSVVTYYGEVTCKFMPILKSLKSMLFQRLLAFLTITDAVV